MGHHIIQMRCRAQSLSSDPMAAELIELMFYGQRSCPTWPTIIHILCIKVSYGKNDWLEDFS